MSAISVGCEEAYKTSVDVTCESVDSSIKVNMKMLCILWYLGGWGGWGPTDIGLQLGKACYPCSR